MVRNVIVIVIDCLRADHVSSYGYERATTPTIDALAKEGIRWEQAYSTSSWTKPSVMSLLTGLYPSQHGGFEGVKRSKGRTAATTDVLRSAAPTLAEQFTSAGWRCGAFINNAQLDAFTGLDRGFDTYEPRAGKADRLIAMFREWLTRDHAAPTFGYLHFLEAHWPYKPRRRHIAMFGGDRDTNLFRDFSARDFGKWRRAIHAGEIKPSEQQLEHMMQMYDGAVRRLDGKVKIILGLLDELGLRDETALVVTADHGEEFMDHQGIGHGHSLYEELTHVPLVAYVPGERPGVRCHPVSHTDLAPTLLQLCGIETGGGRTNLVADGDSETSVFGELRIRRRYTQTMRSGKWKLHRRFRFDPPDGQLASATPPRDWVNLYPHRLECELYDLSTDPRERKNLVDEPEVGDTLRRLTTDLDEWWQHLHPESLEEGMAEVEIDDVVVQRLRDLGYIE